VLEAEIKLELDEAATGHLRDRLRELGAGAECALEQCDIYFAHPSRDFGRSDEALRLRRDARGLRLTYKGPKLDPPRKTREEIEFPLDTRIDTARSLLERLGFRAIAEVAKTREDFLLPGPPRAVVSLDRVASLGTFCEIEVEAGTVEEGRARLDGLARRLDLADRPPIAESYLELLLRARA